MSSRRRSLMGKAGVLLGLTEARQVGRGHALPHSQKKRLSDAGELGDGGTVTFPPVSSSSGWMFASPPLWRASAFQGSGSAGSYANCRRLRGVVSLSHAIASLEAGKSPGWPWRIRHSGAVTDLGGYAWRSAQPEGSGSSRLSPRH